MTQKPETTRDIAFRRRGDIMRNGIRVGWIERQDDMGPITWRVRFTPASGISGVHGDFPKLGAAKTAARMALEALNV